ncbi:receptor-type tyrosine-protein phosphatase N2 [Suncus etruscus]|uniref:receptor-type tyrosine-protein phosphatase N2 n=1 Tax=Suncus etruscus TaxID=109475 RepID=UPI00210FFCB0|nr:receptor-type tyrosine-protein phosphatase N2 [Suncus etruscus]
MGPLPPPPPPPPPPSPPPLLLLLLLLLLPPGPPAAPAPLRPLPGRPGCLFRDGLCRASEVCVDDGEFGKCQPVPAMDAQHYPMSPGTQQRLATNWQQSPQKDTGFQWQDGSHAQHVMAQELADLLGIPPRRSTRLSPRRANKLDRDLALATALQHSMPYLEALAPTPDGHAWARQAGAPIQAGDVLASNRLTQMSALTYAPEPLRPLQPHWYQPDQLSPKMDSDVDRQSLMEALSSYMSRNAALGPRAHSLEGHGALPIPWGVPRGQSAAAAAPQKRPFTVGDRLDSGDNARIWKLLKNPRKLQANSGTQEPLSLNEMLLMVAGTEQSGGKGDLGEAPRGRPGEQGDRPTATFAAHGRPEPTGHSGPDTSTQADPEVNPWSPSLMATWLNLSPRPLPRLAPPPAPFSTEGPQASLSSEEEPAGLETVRSQTYFWKLGPGHHWMPTAGQESQSLEAGDPGHAGSDLRLEVESPSEQGYMMTDRDPLSLTQGEELVGDMARLLDLPRAIFSDIRVLGPLVTFRVTPGVHNLTAADVAKAAANNRDRLQSTTGLKVLRAGIGSGDILQPLPQQGDPEDSTKFAVLTLVSVAAIVGVLLASVAIHCLRHSSPSRLQKKLRAPAVPACTTAYQELCRQRMAGRSSEHTSRIHSTSLQFSDEPVPSPSARSSTSSWSEEPVQPNMDISTGHMVLAYMEDHLRNKDRLREEWQALCAYVAEPNSSTVAQREENVHKNRCPAVLAYDHSRVMLKAENSCSQSDYINASPIMDRDPRSPSYIAAQGPLPATVADFWQMVWESGCVVVVMLTPLAESGEQQCHHYWPDSGANLYHIYEVNLVSEHIWCEDFLVRSFYLKNVRTQETRTVTQFHFLSWYNQAVPFSTGSLLDFRRKVNKCYRGRACPIIVHCSDGAGRSGTYILIDLVLNRMVRGAKEIDIAATLEHLRDQRPGMVQTKEQFEFALTAVAEEVNAILKALPQ